MEKVLYITVAGKVGTGKTTIAKYINDSLQALNCNVTLKDDEDLLSLKDHAKRFCKVLQDKDLKIEIETKQLGRDSVDHI